MAFDQEQAGSTEAALNASLDELANTHGLDRSDFGDFKIQEISHKCDLTAEMKLSHKLDHCKAIRSQEIHDDIDAACNVLREKAAHFADSDWPEKAAPTYQDCLSNNGGVIYEARETYQHPCKPCSASGQVTCQNCDGQTKVACGGCNGHGKQRCFHCNLGRLKCNSCTYGTIYVSENGRSVQKSCRSCNGSGYDRMCWHCTGTMKLTCMRCSGQAWFNCRTCSATGRVGCQRCDASGTALSGVVITSTLSFDRTFTFDESDKLISRDIDKKRVELMAQQPQFTSERIEFEHEGNRAKVKFKGRTTSVIALPAADAQYEGHPDPEKIAARRFGADTKTWFSPKVEDLCWQKLKTAVHSKDYDTLTRFRSGRQLVRMAEDKDAWLENTPRYVANLTGLTHNVDGAVRLVKMVRSDLDKRISRGEGVRGLLFITYCIALGMAAHSSEIPYQVGQTTGLEHYVAYLMSLPVLLLLLTIWHVRRRRKRRARRSIKIFDGRIWSKEHPYVGRPPHWLFAVAGAMIFAVIGYVAGSHALPVIERWDERNPPAEDSFEAFFQNRYGGPVHPDTCKAQADAVSRSSCRETLMMRPIGHVLMFLEIGETESLDTPPL